MDSFVFHAEADVTYTVMLSTLDCVGTANYLGVTARSLTPTAQTVHLNEWAYFERRYAYEIRSNTTTDELISFTTSSTCQYDFSVVQSTAQGLDHDARGEPNDSASTATMLPLNQLVESQISWPADAVDYYTVPVLANVLYTVHLSLQRCDGSANSIILSAESLGSGVAVSNLPETYLYFGRVYDLEFTTTTSGLERLLLRTSASCEYDLYVIPSTICGLTHDPGADLEPNGTPSTAAPIGVNEIVAAEVQSPSDRIDNYVFSVEPKTKYTLSLTTSDCVGSANCLLAQLWSGRGQGLLNGSKSFCFDQGPSLVEFTTGNAETELLTIESAAPCAYQLNLSKN